MGTGSAWGQGLHQGRFCMGAGSAWGRVLHGDGVCMGAGSAWGPVLHGSVSDACSAGGGDPVGPQTTMSAKLISQRAAPVAPRLQPSRGVFSSMQTSENSSVCEILSTRTQNGEPCTSLRCSVVHCMHSVRNGDEEPSFSTTPAFAITIHCKLTVWIADEESHLIWS